MRRPNWTRILTILLVILASYAILYITGTILMRFTGAILLFVLGAMLAYILNPLVRRLEAAFHFRWLAILMAYFFVAAGLVALAVLLFTPFIEQTQSLVDNLHNPSRSSLVRIDQVQRDADSLRDRVVRVAGITSAGSLSDDKYVKDTRTAITQLQIEVQNLKKTTVRGKTTQPRVAGVKEGKGDAVRPPQTPVPPVYVDDILAQLRTLRTRFDAAQANNLDPNAMHRAVTSARQVATKSHALYHTMATTPILLLLGQVWLDTHSIRVDLPSKFGQAAGQISNQGTYILDNAITILSETATILLNTVLILIISVYLVSDGSRILRSLALVLPGEYREQAWFFVTSLDQVLGGYIRGQLFLSALAGVLAGGGAAALGVPYPLLIGLMTFILESIPIIGPLVAVVPALIISLFFTSVFTTVLMVVWFVIYQQVVTNVLGPRIMGLAVGIHPLEALVAVLVGYPLGGLLGAFLAVPIAGVVHILIREAYRYFALGHALPTAPLPEHPEAEESETAAGPAVTTRKVTPAP